MSDVPTEKSGWYFESPTVWARMQLGRSAEVGLLLRVWLDVEAETDLWTWEVAEVTDESPSETEVDVGGAATRENAMAAALSRAAAFLRSGE